MRQRALHRMVYAHPRQVGRNEYIPLHFEAFSATRGPQEGGPQVGVMTFSHKAFCLSTHLVILLCIASSDFSGSIALCTHVSSVSFPLEGRVAIVYFVRSSFCFASCSSQQQDHFVGSYFQAIFCRRMSHVGFCNCNILASTRIH